MRTQIKTIVVAGFLLLSSCSSNSTPQSYGSNADVSFQVFYAQLSPYGMWMNYPPYGYVWLPEAGMGFTPYLTSGNWVYTSFGWTWHSYYSWGWAPFHYGRWFYDSLYGWVWVPDTVWGPAWVVWSMGGGYCGWAPLRPGISVSVVINGGYTVPREHWIFVRDNDLTNRNIGRYRTNKSKNNERLESAMLVRQVREQNNVAFMTGPERNTIQKVTGKPITLVAIREKHSPGHARMRQNELEIFKPRVQKEISSVNRDAPLKVYERDEVKTRNKVRATRNEGYQQRGNQGREEFFEYRQHPSQQKGNLSRGNEHRGNSGKPKKKGN